MSVYCDVEQNLAVSPDVMRLLGREDQGVRLPDGNYFATFTAFHHLHCLVSRE